MVTGGGGVTFTMLLGQLWMGTSNYIKNNHVILLSSLSTVKKAVYRIVGNFRGVKYSLFSWAS